VEGQSPPRAGGWGRVGGYPRGGLAPRKQKDGGGAGKKLHVRSARYAHQQERSGMSLLMPKLALATRRRNPMLSIDNTLKLPKIAVHRIKHDFKILNWPSVRGKCKEAYT